MPWNLIGNIRGATGPAGERGSTWSTGSGAPTTPGQLAGDQYLDSENGNVYTWTGSSWNPTANIAGPPGEPGTPGAKWFTGTGTPTIPGSNSGDFFLDSDLGNVYEWNGSSWDPVGNLAGPMGPQGNAGADGSDGSDGLSAYEVAVQNGFIGTEAQWLVSLIGATGSAGPAGSDGSDGLSAYQVAVQNGFSGTQAEWLESLVGADGTMGPAGLSAYQVAVDNGFVGSETAWLASLVGEQGPVGPPGDPDDLASIAFTGSADDLTAGTIPDERFPGRLQGAGQAITTTAQLDALRNTGFYRVTINASPTGNYGMLLMQGTLSGGRAQLFTDTETHRIYTRSGYGTGTEWSAWERTAFLDVAAWVTELDEQVTTEDDVALEFVVGIK